MKIIAEVHPRIAVQAAYQVTRRVGVDLLGGPGNRTWTYYYLSNGILTGRCPHLGTAVAEVLGRFATEGAALVALTEKYGKAVQVSI